MSIDFTPYLWANWAIVAFTLGAFWTLGCWAMSALLGAMKRGPG